MPCGFRVALAGVLPRSSTPEELRQHIASEIARRQRVREKAGIEQQ
jgi:tripartite-type tricarboxylate transporter receptor subunit TctC